ncbi:MAG: DUF115 domain-containing protein [Methanobacteriota archaeon]|nr:MAG: DUF115 domain-containing protein [Euryarchaeota archaeon]
MTTDHIEYWVSSFLPRIRDYLGLDDSDRVLLKRYAEIGSRNTLDQEQVFNSIVHLVPKKNKGSLVFGAAENLVSQVRIIQDFQEPSLADTVLISADGATRLLLKKGLVPDIMFTDLDCGLDLVETAINEEIWVFILLHPDNVALFDEFLEMSMDGKVVFCTQDTPIHGFVNTFGFTDGDRATSFSVLSGLKTLTVGFDLDGLPGFYSVQSKKVNLDYVVMKHKKLTVAKEVLSYLANQGMLYTFDEKLAPGIELEGGNSEAKLAYFFSLIDST